MIYSLKGTVQKKISPTMVIEVNNIGYIVHCTQHMLNKYSNEDPIDVITYHHIREDAQLLFGFETEKERELFESLISVSGIGPKVAINILSSISISDLVSAIQTENIMIITQCPGIGKKTAERMVIELKDKVQGLAGAPKVIEKTTETVSSHDSDDIVLALRQLGYQKDEIKRGFMKHAKELSTVTSIEDQIKILLKYL